MRKSTNGLKRSHRAPSMQRPSVPTKNVPVRVAITATDEAFIAMILEEHAALIRHADQKRDARMAPLLSDRNIPEGVLVTIEKDSDGVAHLVYAP